jgi:hypothetical protein
MMCLPRCASGPYRLASYTAGPQSGPSISPRLEVWFDGGSRGNPGVAGAGALVFWRNDFGKQL